MISYKDMTFCPFFQDCETPCERSLTEEIKAESERLDLPVSIFISYPSCFKVKIEETNFI